MNIHVLIKNILCLDPVQEKDGISLNDISFAVLLALLSTAISYQFAVGNQLEQLPLIIRQLDPSYLVNDFFLSTTEDFGPRTYFITLLGFICQFIPISWAYIGLTFVSDFALVGVTLWAARTVIETNRLGASLAAVMTLGLASFHLGDATQIRYEIFQPASLAIPGVLVAIVMGFRGWPIFAVIVASLSGLFHPLYGAEGGGIALGIAFFSLLLSNSDKALSGSFIANLNWSGALKKTIPAAAVLALFLAVFWWLPYRDVNAGVNLSTEDFYNILARFRAPHHYLPSHFRLNDFVSTIFFLIAFGFTFEYWAQRTTRKSIILLLFPIIVVLFCCLIAYVFSEIWPVRAILTLQLFRLLFLVKWLGFLLFASVLSLFLLRPSNNVVRPLSLISLLSTGVTQPILLSLSLATIRFKPWCWIRMNPKVCILLISFLALFMWSLFADLSELVYLFFAYALVFAFVLEKGAARLIATTAIIVLIFVLVINRGTDGYSGLMPIIDLKDQHNLEAETAWSVAEVTPVNALLVAPPEFGLLRIIGGRALVIDFKSIPFQDVAMKEWRQRMRNVYGEVSGGGFKAVKKLDKAYRAITDKKLLELAQLYGATHAVLYRETKTTLPEMYTNDVYRVVKLSYK